MLDGLRLMGGFNSIPNFTQMSNLDSIKETFSLQQLGYVTY